MNPDFNRRILISWSGILISYWKNGWFYDKNRVLRGFQRLFHPGLALLAGYTVLHLIHPNTRGQFSMERIQISCSRILIFHWGILISEWKMADFITKPACLRLGSSLWPRHHWKLNKILDHSLHRTRSQDHLGAREVSKNDEFCIQNEEFCIQNDEFCRAHETDGTPLFMYVLGYACCVYTCQRLIDLLNDCRYLPYQAVHVGNKLTPSHPECEMNI